MKWSIAIMVFAGLVLVGCKTKYVSVPEIHTEYITRVDTTVRKDSVYLKDSVYVERKGDTLYVNKTLYRDRYHNIYKVKLDTIFRHDSIEVPVPCERTLTKSEQRLMTLGRCYIAFLFLVVVVGIGFVFWYHNKKC